MKTSISIWSFYGNWSFEEKLRLAREAGFAGFEVDLSADGPVNLRSTAEELRAVQALAERCGVALSGPTRINRSRGSARWRGAAALCT